MNIISGISSGFKAIFGVGQSGSDNVMTVAKGIGGYIDDLSYTDAEKAKKHSTITIPAFQKFMDSTVEENTERSRTRRDIAIWIIRNWFIMLWVTIFSYGFELVINAAQHEFSKFVLGIATLSAMIYLVLGVGGFFFGAHIIRQTGNQFKNK
jgi:Na+/melibiose symporter-like transporter